MSKSSPPVSSIANPPLKLRRTSDAAGEENGDPAAPKSKSFHAQFAAAVRWLHIYVSLLGFTTLLFFAVTGITLNHPTWFGIEAQRTTEHKGEVNRAWLNKPLPAGMTAAPENENGEIDYALRFHLHPSVKASRLSDARGVMLVLPNRDVWTFEALDDKVDLEDSVFLAGNDRPRRTAQIVIWQDSQHVSSVRWSFVRSTTSAAATNARRNAKREPELPL